MQKKYTGARFAAAMTATCLVFAISQGIRDNYGIMLNGLTGYTGISYASISFVIAVGQFLYGVTQPLFGLLALKKSNAFVMLCGIFLMIVGLVATPFCTSFWSLMIFFGIFLPCGTGALCFGIVMGALALIIGEKRATAVSGIIQASVGIGDALMSPALQQLMAWKGISFSMITLSVPLLLMIPVVIWLAIIPEKTDPAKQRKDEKLFTVLKHFFKDPAYWKLMIGFSTCGFHMAIIGTHLFSQYIVNGIPERTASFTLTLYGITTMIGAAATGFLGQKFKMQNVLGSVYGFRVLISVAFLIFPISVPFAFISSGLLGLTGASTVPPTSGIVSAKVGIAKMAIVYGSLYIGHQTGSFISTWLGGILMDAPMGYSGLWIINLFLCLIAAVASFRIRD